MLRVNTGLEAPHRLIGRRRRAPRGGWGPGSASWPRCWSGGSNGISLGDDADHRAAASRRAEVAAHDPAVGAERARQNASLKTTTLAARLDVAGRNVRPTIWP